MLINFEGRAIENDSSARKVERSYLIEEMDVVDPISVVHQYQIDAVQVGSKHLSDQEINRIVLSTTGNFTLNWCLTKFVFKIHTIYIYITL